MDACIIFLGGLGVIVLLTAWLPMVLKDLPLSLPIFCVAFGAVLLYVVGAGGETPSPQKHLKLTERLTEFVVIVALTGAGLKLDRPLSWAGAALTWRLLGLAMPLSIAGIALLAFALLVRPAAAWIGFAGRPEPNAEKAVIGFFGIRGIGSVYYLAYALDRAPFDGADVLWSAAAMVIVISIVLHGATVTPVMRFIDRRRQR